MFRDNQGWLMSLCFLMLAIFNPYLPADVAKICNLSFQI